jgi:predicted O-methyltransferase YrrM
MSAELLKARPDLTLYMIDSWTPICPDDTDERIKKTYHDEYIENMSAAVKAVAEYNHRPIVIREDSLGALEFFEYQSLDFVFIDASHNYEDVKRDINFWRFKVKPGGIICGHDYGSWPGVKQAVDEIFPCNAKTATWPEFDEDFFWSVRLK